MKLFMSKTECDAIYRKELVQLDTVMQMSALSTVGFHASSLYSINVSD
jgi:hypothetical protein